MNRPIVSRQISRTATEYTDGRRSATVTQHGTSTGRYFDIQAGSRHITVRRRRQAVLAALRYVRTGEVWTDYRA